MIANLDGLVGPTHNYAGISHGNIASTSSSGGVSNPKRAALQGLAKARFLTSLGLPQGLLPPHERPHIETLRRLGFSGSDADVLASAARSNPAILAAVCSASAMWTANAATVTAASTSLDGRVHFTPANLASKFHRSIEAPTTSTLLRAIFHDDTRYTHHSPLPAHDWLGDEGAANHMALSYAPLGPDDGGQRAASRRVEIFVYGREATSHRAPAPQRFPARQTLEASRSVARLHGLRPDSAIFVQQHPMAIDVGVFHNDVIAVADGAFLLCHEDAFVDADGFVAKCRLALGDAFKVRIVQRSEVTLEEAVRSYLFNSQLVTVAGERWLLAPVECREIAPVSAVLDALLAEGEVQRVEVFDLRESMRNGGGPACLRLRVPLHDGLLGTHPSAWLNDARYEALAEWVKRHYRDRLAPGDLADPALLDESRTALDELTQLLGLGAFYAFQRA